MEGEIPLEVRMKDGIAHTPALVNGIDRLHASIKAKDKEVQIQADAQTVGHGYLLVEFVELELPAGLLLILAQRPDIARIHKDGTPEFPEEPRAILNAGIQLDVARLVQKVIIAGERAGSQITHRPAAHAIRPA